MRNYGRATTLFLLFLFIIPLAGICADRFPAWELSRRFPGLSAENIRELESEGELTRYFYAPGDLAYFPALPEDIAGAVVADIEGTSPNVGVESLFLLEVPGLAVSHESGLERGDLLTIYNTLRTVSSLEGVEYYSASRKRMRTFFREAYAISDISSRERVPDPLVESVPREETVLIHQRDLTFGKNTSEAVYRHSKDVINLSLTNLEIMRYALLPFIQERGMRTHLIILPMDGYIGFYAYCGVETISFLGIEKSKSDSFYNRMKALYTWFRENLPPL